MTLLDRPLQQAKGYSIVDSRTDSNKQHGQKNSNKMLSNDTAIAIIAIVT